MKGERKPLLNFDTIAAIATPPGSGGVGIIRISGERARVIGSKISGLKQLKPRFAHFATFSNPESNLQIDQGLLLYFNAPHSFTGEDVVELQCHGSMVVLEKLLGICLNLGATLAPAGEFSKRAFLNGKLSLTEAESIIDLIDSKSEKGRKVSLHHYQGALHKRIATLKGGLMHCLQHIEASINFPDEVDRIPRDELNHAISQALEFASSVLANKDYGAYVFSGVDCLILGAPNAGKSSFLNTMLGESRAIVSDTAGTTRDYINSSMTLGGLQFQFTDTAGMRNATDAIEEAGISKINTLIKNANAVIWMIDANQELPSNTDSILHIAHSKAHRYALLNKSDLEPVVSAKNPALAKFTTIPISANTGKGIEQFKAQLVTDFVHSLETIDEATLCNVRQIHCIEAIKRELEEVSSATAQGYEDDLLAINLKAAIAKLDELSGDEINEEVLDGIFSRFCVGK